MSQIKVRLQGVFGDDETVYQAAKTSTGFLNKPDAKEIERLLNFLIDSGHDGCFEHIVFRFHITCPQRISTQIVRHRIASYNWASARYGFEFTEVYDVYAVACLEGILDEQTAAALYNLQHATEKLFKLHQGFAESISHLPTTQRRRLRDLAAFSLPQGVMTLGVMTINANSLKNFFKLRLDAHAQKEIREVAELMWADIFGWYGKNRDGILRFLPSPEGS